MVKNIDLIDKIDIDKNIDTIHIIDIGLKYGHNRYHRYRFKI